MTTFVFAREDRWRLPETREEMLLKHVNATLVILYSWPYPRMTNCVSRSSKALRGVLYRVSPVIYIWMAMPLNTRMKRITLRHPFVRGKKSTYPLPNHNLRARGVLLDEIAFFLRKTRDLNRHEGNICTLHSCVMPPVPTVRTMYARG